MQRNRQMLIANLKEDQKSIFGLISMHQLSVCGIGLIIGVILYQISNMILKSSGVSVGVCLIFGTFLFVCAAGPFFYIAFKPIKDNQDNILYYLDRQLIINFYYKDEVGTYLNLKKPTHLVNKNLPYVKRRAIDD